MYRSEWFCGVGELLRQEKTLGKISGLTEDISEIPERDISSTGWRAQTKEISSQWLDIAEKRMFTEVRSCIPCLHQVW